MPPRAPTPLPDRLLGLCPPAIAVLWVAGIAHFRAFELSPVEWAVLAAAGFSIHVVVRRFARPRPLPKLPDGARPGPVAAFAAALLALLAAVVGGVAEAMLDDPAAREVPWALRTLWHAACAFGASYCSFLQRLWRAARR